MNIDMDKERRAILDIEKPRMDFRTKGLFYKFQSNDHSTKKLDRLVEGIPLRTTPDSDETAFASLHMYLFFFVFHNGTNDIHALVYCRLFCCDFHGSSLSLQRFNQIGVYSLVLAQKPLLIPIDDCFRF